MITATTILIIKLVKITVTTTVMKNKNATPLFWNSGVKVLAKKALIPASGLLNKPTKERIPISIITISQGTPLAAKELKWKMRLPFTLISDKTIMTMTKRRLKPIWSNTARIALPAGRNTRNQI